MNEALSLYQIHFPRGEMLFTMHQMCHLVEQIREYGPLRETWMFPFEGFMQVVKKACKNRQVPAPLVHALTHLGSLFMRMPYSSLHTIGTIVVSCLIENAIESAATVTRLPVLL